MTAARASQLPAEGPECIPLPRDADATCKKLCISCRLGVFRAYVAYGLGSQVACRSASSRRFSVASQVAPCSSSGE